MKKFLKYALATLVGTMVGVFLSTVILFFIIAGIIGFALSSSHKDVTIHPNSVLCLDLEKPFPEKTSQKFFENLDFKNLKFNTNVGVYDMVKLIKQAKTDPNIKGIYIKGGLMKTGFGTVEEIRNALLEFKTSHKFIVSYADYYTHGSYYIATAADSIFMNPQGNLILIGLRSEMLFYKGLFEKLEIEPIILRHGKFKSYVEPYTSDKISEANRLQLTTLLSSIWSHLLEGISDRRHISVEELNAMADNLTIKDANAALTNKLIDGLRYPDEVHNSLAKLCGVVSFDKLEMISLEKYYKHNSDKASEPDKKIALIYATGEIGMDSDGDDNISAVDLCKTIRKAREDKDIKAIVLRINSPGGSSIASDLIWRELFLTKKVKPVIVSMGSVAASGGYYIAAMADTILADPTTITGSIGVFGMTFNVKNLLKNKLGITSDVVTTNKYSDLGSFFRPITPQEKEVLQLQVEHTYDTFLHRVAEGRKMTPANVDSIAQGRVWSALDAKRIGLVDLIGDLNTAIEITAAKVKLSSYDVVEFPKVDSPFSGLLKETSASVKDKLIYNELGKEKEIYTLLKQACDRKGIQTMLPWEITIY